MAGENVGLGGLESWPVNRLIILVSFKRPKFKSQRPHRAACNHLQLPPPEDPVPSFVSYKLYMCVYTQREINKVFFKVLWVWEVERFLPLIL